MSSEKQQYAQQYAQQAYGQAPPMYPQGQYQGSPSMQQQQIPYQGPQGMVQAPPTYPNAAFTQSPPMMHGGAFAQQAGGQVVQVIGQSISRECVTLDVNLLFEAPPAEPQCCCCGARNGLIIFMCTDERVNRGCASAYCGLRRPAHYACSAIYLIILIYALFNGSTTTVVGQLTLWFSTAATVNLTVALFRDDIGHMQVAKWMFTTVCSVSVLIDIIMIIVALGAADSACAESYTSGTSEYATCVQLYNALAPSILLFAGVLVALRALLLGIIANRAFAQHKYLLQMKKFNERTHNGQNIKLNQVVVTNGMMPVQATALTHY